MNADIYPTPAEEIQDWDHEADVVIAGYGIAGAAAAVEAARRVPTSSSSSAPEAGVARRRWRAGSSTSAAAPALQKACGFDDSVDNMAAFLNVAMGPGADENRIADYCAGSVEHFDWLVSCGVPFKPEFWGEPGWEPPGDRGADVHRRRERVPVQHHRETRSARPCSADGQQKGWRGECRLHADEATGRHRHVAWACGRSTTSMRRRWWSSPTAASPGSSPASTASRSRFARGEGLSFPRAASRTTTQCSLSTRRGSSGVPPRRSNSTTGRASGWRRPSARTSPTWTPPRWRF